MCEHYIARGLCTDFPDWSIATAGSEASLKIGYDYGRLVTGEKLDIGIDLEEEAAVLTGGDQEVPDPLKEETMVATSAEVHACFTIWVSEFISWTFFLSCCSHFLFYVASGSRGARA